MLISLGSILNYSWDDVWALLKQLCLSIDTIIYNAIGWMYTVFMALAGARIFTTDLVNSFVQRMYLIVSIVMLFIVAYSFLNVIINPDNMTKGDSSPTKLVTNVVKALLIIVLVPSAFSFAFAFQKSVIKQNVIGKLVLGTKRTVSSDEVDSDSSDFAVTLFEANFYPKDEYLNEDMIGEKGDYTNASKNARAENDISEFSVFMTRDRHKEIQYNYIICGLVGLYALYTLLIFSIDLGLRVVKLLFYEMIAPFPALLMMVPGQDKAIKNWFKLVFKSFADLFIKVAIISLGVFLINAVSDGFKNSGEIIGFESTNRTVISFAKIFILLGVVMFMRKAPKYIEDLFGWKLDEKGLSLRKRLDEAGVTALFGGAAGAVAGTVSSVRGAKARGGNRLWAGLGGAFHGARLGGKAGWNGSYQGIGDAYNYGWANQQAWSHMDPERGYLLNQLSVAGEMLRDNVGMQSYYDDLKDQARIEHDVITSANNRKMQAIDKEFNEMAKKLDSKHEFDARSSANERFMTAANKSNDTAKAEVYKDGYTGTTMAYVPVSDGAGGYIIQEQEVSAAQFGRIKETLSDAVSNGSITAAQEQAILGELDSAEKRLKNDYDTNTLVSEKRDNGYLSDPARNTAIKSNYIDSYVENMKSQKHWDGATFVDFDHLSAADQATKEAAWRTAANAKYDDITVNSPSDYKTNLSHASELHEVLDLASISKRSSDGRGFIDDAAGQSFDTSTGRFTTSSAVRAISDNNGNTDHVISGVDIQAAIKAVKNMDVNGERSSVYRTTDIKINGTNTKMSQAHHIKQSLIDANKKADKDLEDKMLSLKSDEQTAEAARKIGKFRAHGKDSGKK